MFKPRRPSRAEVGFALSVYGAPGPAAPAVLPAARPRGAKSNRRRGTAVEGAFGGQGVAALLKAEGYTVVRSHESQGAADVIGLRARLDVDGPPVRAVQAKRLRVFRPGALNDAVSAFLGVGKHWRGWPLADGTRESWLWIDGDGWAARAVLAPDATLAVSGPRAEEVEKSLVKMLTRATPPNHHQPTPEEHAAWLRQKGLN